MAVIAQDAVIEGNVVIGEGSVVHPKAILRAAPGTSLVLGAQCVVEELACVEAVEVATMVVGDGNVFSVGSLVRDSTLGARNTLRPRCVVEQVTLGDHCVVGAKTTLPHGFVGGDGVSIVGDPPQMSNIDPALFPGEDDQHSQLVTLLADILPKFHHLAADS